MFFGNQLSLKLVTTSLFLRWSGDKHSQNRVLIGTGKLVISYLLIILRSSLFLINKRCLILFLVAQIMLRRYYGKLFVLNFEIFYTCPSIMIKIMKKQNISRLAIGKFHEKRNWRIQCFCR